jgi:hypothetical protein
MKPFLAIIVIFGLFALAFGQAVTKFETRVEWLKKSDYTWTTEPSPYDTITADSFSTKPFQIYNGYIMVEANYVIGSNETLKVLLQRTATNTPTATAITARWKTVDSLQVVTNGVTQWIPSLAAKFGLWWRLVKQDQGGASEVVGFNKTAQ